MLRIEIRARGYLGVPTASVHLVRVGAVADGRQREAARSRCAGSSTHNSGASPPAQVSPLSALITHTSLTASPPLFLIDTDTASTLWPCRTCPTTYCERCLPEEISFAGDEIVCEECQEVLVSDVTTLQRDLIKWKPELFAK